MAAEKFDREWREAFKGASMTPSDKVWTGIEAAIANDEAATYKKRLGYYKWVAAAGLLLFATALGYLAYQWITPKNQRVSEQVIDQETESGTSQIENNSTPDNALDQLENNAGNTAAGDQFDQSGDQSENNKQGEDSDRSSENSAAGISQDPSVTERDNISKDQRENLIAVSTEKGQDSETPVKDQEALVTSPVEDGVENSQSDLAVTNNDNIGDNVSLRHQQSLAAQLNPLDPHTETQLQVFRGPDHVYSVALTVPPIVREKESSQLWAGLNLAPGQFDPNYRLNDSQNDFSLNPNTSRDPDTNEQFLRDEQTSSGFSLGLSLDVGMKISSRWEINSGLQYYRNSAQSSTNAVLGQTPLFSSVVESLGLSSDAQNVSSFSPTELDNDFQFVSIPLEAGYRVMDGKVAITLNAGVAADLLLKNTIDPKDESLNSISITPGSNSPFRSVFFNGLVGVAASYEFLPRYSLTLQPQYKVALNQFTKPDLNYTSQPSSFGLGLGIKYNFK